MQNQYEKRIRLIESNSEGRRTGLNPMGLEIVVPGFVGISKIKDSFKLFNQVKSCSKGKNLIFPSQMEVSWGKCVTRSYCSIVPDNC